MLLSAVCVLLCLLFVFCVRKHKKILSALIAVEIAVLISMLVVTYLSAAGTNNAYVLIMAKAISTKHALLCVSVSSLMLLQAVVVLLACSVSLYAIYRVIRKVLKSKQPAFEQRCPALKAPAYVFRGTSKRKVFMLYCRLNN